MTPDIFRGSPVRSKLIWNTTWQLIGRAVSAFTTLGITILIARRFGTSGYGDFIKIVTFVSFFYLIADFGFNAIFLQRSPLSQSIPPKKYDANWNELLGLRIFISSLLVFVALIILACIPWGSLQGYTGLVRMGILLFAPTIVFQALVTTANALFQKYLRYDIATMAVVIGSCVSLLLVWITTQGNIGSSIIMGITSLLIGSGVTAIVGLWFARTLVSHMNMSVSPKRLWSLFVASFPLGLTLIFNLVYFHVDSVILTLTRSTAEVGIYGLVYKVFELALVVPTFFMNALYPVMLGVVHENTVDKKKKFNTLFFRSAALLLLVSGFTFFLVWFAAPLIVLVKADFSPGVGALQVLSFGLPFFFLSSLTMWTLITAHKQRTLAYVYGISMVLNILLNIIFTPTHGYMAAAWITVVSEAFVLFISGLVVIRVLR